VVGIINPPGDREVEGRVRKKQLAVELLVPLREALLEKYKNVVPLPLLFPLWRLLAPPLRRRTGCDRLTSQWSRPCRS
jgi:hypothetical protein